MKMNFEAGCAYISIDGNRVWIGLPNDKLVRWDPTIGWIEEIPKEPISISHDLPCGAIVRCWATSLGAMDDIRERFFTPHVYRDLTKRPYKTWRNGGVLSESGEPEDQMESWILFRVHKLAIRLNED